MSATEAAFKKARGMGYDEKVMLQVLFNSAQVLKNVKISSIFSVPSAYLKTFCASFYGSGIKFHVLCKNGDSVMVFLYRENNLKDYLNRPQIVTFIRQFGYINDDTLTEMIRRLSFRMNAYSNGQMDFPHELGAFLGYPIEDIVGFIRNHGENFSLIGYWKVYANVDRARETFRRYDEAREETMSDFILGKNIKEIAC